MLKTSHASCQPPEPPLTHTNTSLSTPYLVPVPCPPPEPPSTHAQSLFPAPCPPPECQLSFHQINEPAFPGQANAFLHRWHVGKDIGLQNSAAIESVSLHAGSEGIPALTEITWHYGPDDRPYPRGRPCPRMKKSDSETPATYFLASRQNVPPDAYVLTE